MIKKDNFSMKILNLFLIISVTVVFSALNSCKDKSPENSSNFISSEKEFIVRDDSGEKIKFDSHPSRIISLAPNITEALFAIGADSLIVGVTDLCDYPPEAKNKKKTGSYLTPDYETISGLKPDLILIYAENSSQPAYQALRNLNMKLFVCNPVNSNDIIRMITNLGKITGKELKAQEVAQNFVNERQELYVANRKAITESCLLIVSVNPLMTASGKTFVHEITELSGFDNLYKDERIDYPLLSYEDVTVKNPAYIILPCDTTNEKKISNSINEISEKLNTTSAVKNKKIILVDENIIFRPGPRILEGVKIIRKKADNFNMPK